MKRREVLIAGFGTLLLRPAAATPESMQTAIAIWCGAAKPQEGRVTLEIAPLIDNGNAVPVLLRCDSAMTPTEHVRELALFNEKNPNTEVAVFHLGPRCGRAQVATRIRLATSQQLALLAKMNDGSVWQQRVDVIVTLAACIES